MDSVLRREHLPLLRGVSHQWAFVASLLAGTALVTTTSGPVALAAASVFAAATAAMFGASALYHRVGWRPALRPWLRRVDHAAIFLLIGGCYTSYGLVVLEGAWRLGILAAVWAGVGAAIVLRFVWVSAPSWVAAGFGLGLGWFSLLVIPQAVAAIGLAGVGLLVAAGVLYSAGALVYALRRPDPFPAVFGYHEVFHALVIAAVACQYVSVAFFLLPEA